MRPMLCVAALLALAATMHAATPFAGTWKLNVAKSQQGLNPVKELTVVITEKGDQIEGVLKGVLADGRQIFERSTGPSKGGVRRTLEGGPPDAARNTVMVKIIDDWTWESTTTRDGKVIGTVRFVVSKDGRTQTATFTGTDQQGKPVRDVLILDRQ